MWSCLAISQAGWGVIIWWRWSNDGCRRCCYGRKGTHTFYALEHVCSLAGMLFFLFPNAKKLNMSNYYFHYIIKYSDVGLLCCSCNHGRGIENFDWLFFCSLDNLMGYMMPTVSVHNILRLFKLVLCTLNLHLFSMMS